MDAKPAPSPAPESGRAVASVNRDLARVAKVDPDLAQSALAAAAMSMAEELDGSNSATSKSMCARALLDLMDRIADLMPAGQEDDALDDLARRRAARLSGGAAS